MTNIILFADYFDQLTIVDEAKIDPSIKLYNADTKKDLFKALDNLTPKNPWFYIKTKKTLLRYLK